jgi:signal transduction histidine kinase
MNRWQKLARVSGLLRNRSLPSRFILLVIAPLSLVLFGVILVNLVVYQETLTSLVVSRDQQLAAVVMERVSETMRGYAQRLEAAAGAPGLRSPSSEVRAAALANASASLRLLNAGTAIVDQNGQLLTILGAGSASLENTIVDQNSFRQVKDQRQAVFSNAIQYAADGRYLVVITVPIFDGQQHFWGALLGAFYLDNAPIESSLQQLTIGAQGYAYIVDHQGRVLFHPDPVNIGADFADRPFVKEVIAGQSGGTLWSKPGSGETLAIGYAPIQIAGWGLIVRESWDSVSAPVRTYGLMAGLVSAVAVALTAYFLWQGVRAVTIPVQWLAAQTSRLAAGDAAEPIPESPITEVNSLSHDFNHMAAQITAYRAGLRRYVGALTQAQEEERRRLSRDLHDETAQSLLAMVRRLELYQASEADPHRLQQLAELQAMITNTLQGVRLISQNLRPPALDDLGLVPALRALVHAAREGEGGVPEAQFDLAGTPGPLTSEQELALYRIAQEALTNIRKHAHATSLRIGLGYEPALVRLEVMDDGCGFTVPISISVLAQHNHFGLMDMQERAWSVGASLTVESQPSRGTRLQVTLPTQA